MSDNLDGLPIPDGALEAVMGSGLVAHLTEAQSRRSFGALGLGALLGLGGALLGGGAQPAEAKPSDVKGSPNIPLRVFHNKNGKFILWADGSFSSPTSNSPRVKPNYSNAPGYPPPTPQAGRTQGSPNVAVDVIQDENGTYVLFADGYVRKPDNNSYNSPPYGDLKYYSFFLQAPNLGGSLEVNSPGLTRSGNSYTFDKPFLEVPLVFAVRTGGPSSSVFFLTGHPMLPVTKNGYTAPLLGNENWGGFVVGKL